MNPRIEAGTLAHADLGKVVEVPMGETLLGKQLPIKGELDHLEMSKGTIWLDVRLGASRSRFTVPLDPHTLVTITGKDAS